MSTCLIRRSSAFVPSAIRHSRASQAIIGEGRRNISRSSLRSNPIEVDDEGRQIRRRGGSNGNNDGHEPSPSSDIGRGWDDFDPVAPNYSSNNDNSNRNNGARSKETQSSSNSGGWDDFDPFNDGIPLVDSTRGRGKSMGGDSRRDRDLGRGGPPRRDRDSRGPPSRGGDSRGPPLRGGRRNDSRGGKEKGADDIKINMNALESAGFVHLYGLSSVLNALEADRRDFERPEDTIDIDLLEGEALEHEMKQRERKPQAQFSPWLFVQERGGKGIRRSTEKIMAAEGVERLAAEHNIPIATVDKGVLNALSGNRPHQVRVPTCTYMFAE